MDGGQGMRIRFKMFAAIFMWVLAVICLVLAVVNFSQRPVESVAGCSLLAVGAVGLLGGWLLSRPARSRNRLR
mgnify:CR=1 FL=1